MKARLGLMAGFGAAGLLLVACLPVSGGGYISGLNGGKANFGFSATCDTSGAFPVLRGPWNYNDKSARVNVAGDFSSEPQPCSGSSSDVQFYFSTYTVQGNCSSGCTGIAQIDVYDSGNHGSTKGDCLAIFLSVDFVSVYSNGGSQTGGTCIHTIHTNLGDLPVTMKPVLGGNLKVGS